MAQKKSYSPPQLFRVELNQEQAILSACSLFARTASANSNVGCRPPTKCSTNPGADPLGCKKSSFPASCQDSMPRAS